MTMSSMNRKRNVVTIETKLETIDQLAIAMGFLFWQCAAILVLLFDYPKKSIIRITLGPN